MSNKKTIDNLDELKKQIKNTLGHYEFGRKFYFDPIGMSLRNRELVKKKSELFRTIIEYTDQFHGTKDELLSYLKEKRNEHSTLSRSYGKNHYNLDEPGASTWIKLPFWGNFLQVRQKNVGPGQLKNSSDAAGILHEVINLVETCDDNIFKPAVTLSR